MRRLALAFVGCLAVWPAHADAPDDGVPVGRNPDDPRQVQVEARVRRAIRDGLAWLARAQNPDGSWSAKVGYKLNSSYQAVESHNDDARRPHVGVSGLAGIAFLANGHVPGRGPYGTVSGHAVDYLLGCMEPSGFITDNGTRMYEHAFAGLYLAEVYGMTHRADLRTRLQQVVRLLVAAQAQNSQGGWRYDPVSRDADISITVCQLQLLRAILNAGLNVPRKTVDDAVAYVLKCRGPGRRGGEGTFYYQSSGHGSRTTFALTAAGLVSLYSAGVYDDPELIRGLAALLRQRHEDDARTYGSFSYFYGHYYAVQAFYQAGAHWDEYYFPLREELLRQQETDGSWLDSVDRTYATAMAVILLSIPNGYLPIFQR